MLNDAVKMGNVLSYGKPRQRVTVRPVGSIRRNDANKLNAISGGAVNNRTATYAADGDAVNQIGFEVVSSCTDDAREEAECVGFNCGKSQPADIGPDAETCLNGPEWYQVILQLKLAAFKQYHG